MTSKERRKQRRRDEHQARKEANRNTPPAAAPLVQASPILVSEGLDFDVLESFSELATHSNLGAARAASKIRSLSKINPERTPEDTPAPTDHTERNRRNAQFSTGPKTPEGKAQSSTNAIRHGLASNRFVIFDWEKKEDFLELLANLRAEHRPATQTEALLVEKMAEHFWLSQRALRLQDMCFHMELPHCGQPKELALYMRYGTTHDRAFHKCLAELGKLRAAQRKTESGFLSQKLKQVARNSQTRASRREASDTQEQTSETKNACRARSAGKNDHTTAPIYSKPGQTVC